MILHLQEFLYQVLNVEAINKRVKGIYFQVPSNSYFPYLYIGDFYGQDISNIGKKLEEINFKVTLYVRDKSLKNALELAEEIKAVLSVKERGKIAFIRFIEERVLTQNDGITQEINMKFKTVILA